MATTIRRSRGVRRPRTPGVAENSHRSGTILPADGEQLGADRREHLEVGEGFYRLPSGVAKRLVGTDRQRAAANRAREDCGSEGEQLGADRREHLEVGEGFYRLPSGVAKRLVGTDRQRAAANRAREDRVDDVTSAGSRVDRLAHQQQPADLDAKTGLLEELAGRRTDHGLAGIAPSPGNEPVGVATFFVTDQQDL